MQPIEPRKIKKNWFCSMTAKVHKRELFNFSSHGPSDNKLLNMLKINYADDAYALYSHNLYPPIHFGNTTNILIVGLSDITKALLRLLIFNWAERKLVSKSIKPFIYYLLSVKRI